MARHHDLVIAVTTLSEIFALLSFWLRIWARRISNAKLWWDDFIMGVGLVR